MGNEYRRGERKDEKDNKVVEEPKKKFKIETPKWQIVEGFREKYNKTQYPITGTQTSLLEQHMNCGVNVLQLNYLLKDNVENTNLYAKQEYTLRIKLLCIISRATLLVYLAWSWCTISNLWVTWYYSKMSHQRYLIFSTMQPWYKLSIKWKNCPIVQKSVCCICKIPCVSLPA